VSKGEREREKGGGERACLAFFQYHPPLLPIISFILVARAGRFVQEVHVTTQLPAADVRSMVAKVLAGMA
jgi:hypothetical protein